MSPTREWFKRAAFCCALSSAVTGVVSIAAAQILLGAALAAMLAGGIRPRLPEGWPWLAAFVALTLVSLAASGAPEAGLPQVKKFYAWLILIAVASTIRQEAQARWLAWGWLGGGALSALWGCRQFVEKYRTSAARGEDFYLSYVAARITGFNSHWMTFSGQVMIALLAGLSLALFALAGRRRVMAWVCLGLMAAALALAWTRGVWIGAAAGAVYLLWSWKRLAVLALPAAALLAVAAGPAGLRERALSVLRPHGATDSNLHRIYTWRTGIEIIKAHPWLGVGPELVGTHFREYVPRDLPARLPPGYYGHLHNIYLHWAAERGLPAAAAAVAFFLVQMARPLRRVRSCPDGERWVHRAAVAILAGVLISGLFEYNLGDSEVLAMTLSWAAASDGLRAATLKA